MSRSNSSSGNNTMSRSNSSSGGDVLSQRPLLRMKTIDNTVNGLVGKLTEEKRDVLCIKIINLVRCITDPRTLENTMILFFNRIVNDKKYIKLYAYLTLYLIKYAPSFKKDEYVITIKNMIMNSCHYQFIAWIDEDGDNIDKEKKKMEYTLIYISELYNIDVITLKQLSGLFLDICLKILHSESYSVSSFDKNMVINLISDVIKISGNKIRKENAKYFNDVISKLCNAHENMTISGSSKAKIKDITEDYPNNCPNNWRKKYKSSRPATPSLSEKLPELDVSEIENEPDYNKLEKELNVTLDTKLSQWELIIPNV